MTMGSTEGLRKPREILSGQREAFSFRQSNAIPPRRRR